jgi:hypothetical protein
VSLRSKGRHRARNNRVRSLLYAVAFVLLWELYHQASSSITVIATIVFAVVLLLAGWSGNRPANTGRNKEVLS